MNAYHSCKQLALLAILLALVACATATGTPPTPAPGLVWPAGYTAEIVAQDLQNPTQMILGPDGRLWLAQLAGGENEGNGQIIALDLQTGAREQLLENLQKPTGLAVLQGALWIATEHDLLRAVLNENNRPAPPQVVLADLPYNGRSNGTLTPTPGGKLLYETSGRRQGNQAAPGAGILWQLDPADPGNPRPLASGLKGAYAHTFDEDGRLWVTEIGDGRVTGAGIDDGPPPEEINLVVEGADFGWPQCFGFQEPALNHDGTVEKCRATRPPVVLFEPHTTPTSLIPSPWQDNTLLVALWNGTAVMAVTFTIQGDNATAESVPFITGFKNPQHLLVMPDNTLLISDYGSGTLYRLHQRP